MFLYSVVLFYLGILSIIDIKKKKIQIWMIGLGVLLLPLAILCGHGISMQERIFGGCLGILLLIMSLVSKQAVGLADSILALFIGCTFGFLKSVNILMISLLLCSLFCAVFLSFHIITKKQRIPFLPFLWTGCLVSIFLPW